MQKFLPVTSVVFLSCLTVAYAGDCPKLTCNQLRAKLAERCQPQTALRDDTDGGPLVALPSNCKAVEDALAKCKSDVDAALFQVRTCDEAFERCEDDNRDLRRTVQDLSTGSNSGYTVSEHITINKPKGDWLVGVGVGKFDYSGGWYGSGQAGWHFAKGVDLLGVVTWQKPEGYAFNAYTPVPTRRDLDAVAPVVFEQDQHSNVALGASVVVHGCTFTKSCR